MKNLIGFLNEIMKTILLKKGLHYMEIGFYYLHVKSREFIYLFLKMCLLFFADENWGMARDSNIS